MKEIVTTIAVVLALSVFFGTGYVLWAKSQKPKARFRSSRWQCRLVTTTVKREMNSIVRSCRRFAWET